jgi:hypothetical protein
LTRWSPPYPRAGLLGLVAGGLFYTFGVIFYALDSRFPWSHGFWHLFVLADSISHYLTTLIYLLPGKNSLPPALVQGPLGRALAYVRSAQQRTDALFSV